MYLAPDGDEAEIATAAAQFLSDAMPIGRLHAAAGPDMSPALRADVGAMGWFALAVPEPLGGSGLSSVEHALFFREAGRQCAPVDLIAQCLAANAATDADLRQDIVGGQLGVSLVVPDGANWRILGHEGAELALLVGENDATIMRGVELEGETRPSLDPANTMRIARSLPQAIDGAEGARVWQLGQLGTAAMLVGIAEAALDMIVDYAKVRETFGRKIGSWQAVRHPCADMAVRVEGARSQLWYAATAIKEEHGDGGVHVDAAKHLANSAALANVDVNIQLHGGIGVTDDHDAHLLLKHTMLLTRLFGTKRSLLGRLLHARLEG